MLATATLGDTLIALQVWTGRETWVERWRGLRCQTVNLSFTALWEEDVTFYLRGWRHTDAPAGKGPLAGSLSHLTRSSQSRWSREMHVTMGTSLWCCAVSVTPGRAAEHCLFQTRPADLEWTQFDVECCPLQWHLLALVYLFFGLFSELSRDPRLWGCKGAPRDQEVLSVVTGLSSAAPGGYLTVRR